MPLIRFYTLKKYNVLFISVLLGVLISCTPRDTSLKADWFLDTSDVPLLAADISRDTTTVASLNTNQVISLWQLKDKQLISQMSLDTSVESNSKISLSDNHQRVAVAGKHYISLLSTKSGDIIQRWRVNGFDAQAQITAIKLNYLGDKVYIGLNEGSVIIVDIANQLRSIFSIHTTTVNQLVLSDNQHVIYSGSYDGSVAKWSTTTGKDIWRIEQPFRITSLAVDTLYNAIFVSDALNSQYVLNEDNGAIRSSLQYLARNRYFRQALFVDNGSKIFISSSKNTINLWDANTGTEISSGLIRTYNMGSTLVDLEKNNSDEVFSISSDGVVEHWSLNSYFD